MKRFFILTLLLVVVIAPLTVSAQGPGEGGIVVEGSTRTSANITSFVPIRCSGVDCANPWALMFPALLGVSPQTQNWEVGYSGTLVTDYTVSDDGLVYTFTLRDDATWSDGTPITAEDAYFVWDAIQQGETIGLSSSYGPAQRDIVDAKIIDDYTIEFTMAEANCQAFNRLAMPVIPASAYGYSSAESDSFDWTTLVDNAEDLAPSITAGPFKFNRLEPGTAIYLEANQDYYDATNGVVVPAGYVFLDVSDENVMLERFIEGGSDNPNFLREPGTFQPVLDAAERGEVDVLNEPGRVWHYVALNLADPSNPQNGKDADGNVIDQGHHPLFGDVRVRQALQHGMNIDEIINGPLNGNGGAMTAGTIPSAFTLHPTLERRAFDLDGARALLDEAGFPATGSPLVSGGDGQRTCVGCMYAEEGTPFEFSLMNVGDVRGDVSLILQDQYAQLGIKVNVEVLDFNTMYDDNMGAQTFDAAVAGWRGGFPFDPDGRSFWGVDADIFGEGYGFNFGSYYNEEFETLGAQVNTIPGCDLDARLEIAHRMQEILWEEQPYLWLYATNSVYAANGIENFDPYPNFGNWNVDTWIVTQ